MVMDKVIQIVKPDPDSHYRLVPCLCKSDNVAFVKYKLGREELWRVQCFDCLQIVDLRTGVQHQVQVEWNNQMRCVAGKG